MHAPCDAWKQTHGVIHDTRQLSPPHTRFTKIRPPSNRPKVINTTRHNKQHGQYDGIVLTRFGLTDNFLLPQQLITHESWRVTTLLATPIARLYGEPLLELPADLFIPPDALAVILQAFEGPLDLLLYLIRKQNINILDIPMAELTHQYFAYIEEMQQHQLELAGEYLVMAAMLIEIKSRLLLPRSPELSEADIPDPRAELVRRLLEYEQIRAAALQLDTLPHVGRDVWLTHVSMPAPEAAPLPHVDTQALRQAWLGLFKRARMQQHHEIHAETLSLRARMQAILELLANEVFTVFEDLFPQPSSVADIVVTFLAILELAKEGLLSITQAIPFAPIYVKLAFMRTNAY